MAYMNQEQKKQLTPAIKAVFKKYGAKGTVAVRHHSTLVVTVTEGALDLIAAANERNSRYAEMRGEAVREVNGYFTVNEHFISEHFTGEARDFLLELNAAMNAGNWDKSDAMTDYFNVGWYVDIKVGRYDRQYVCTSEAMAVAA